MPLTPDDLRALSRLIDQAMTLAPEAQETWIGSLPSAERHLAEPLRQALRERAAATGSRVLPPLSGLGMPAAAARAGERVGPYRLLREIGRGGMGSVWLAERADGSFEREVALKLPHLAWTPGLAERMAGEQRIVARLEHPHIARLYDAGLDSLGRPYIAMERVEGRPIDAWVRDRQLDPAATVRLMVQVVRAVAHAHGRLVIHRDLKPGNVLVSDDGQAHLLDFGIAKLLHAGDEAATESRLTLEHGAALTPAYASPEQFRGEAVTVQSDVYSLGVMLHELLTGASPRVPTGPGLLALGQAVLAGDPPPASSRAADAARSRALRGDLDAIVAKALRSDTRTRYASADALADDLERWLRGDAVAARPDSAAYRWGKLLRRHWLGLSAAAAVGVAVVAGAAIAVVHAQRAERAAERERLVRAFVADVFRVNAQVDPGHAAIRQTASRQELLAGGAGLIQKRFAGQPELQADLYGMLGTVFSDMGAHRLASEYATRQVEVLGSLGADRGDHARALLLLGRTLIADQRLEDAELRLRRALELSRDEPALQVDSSLSLLASLLQQGKFDEVPGLLDAVERRLPAGPSVPRARWLARRAFWTGLQNRFDEALPLWGQAIDAAIAAEGPLSPEAAHIRIAVAMRLAQTPRDAQARAHIDAALAALRALGGVHEVRAAFESARFARRRFIFGRHGSAADALTQIDAGRAELAASTLPLPEWFIPLAEFWSAEVKLATGDIAGAVPVMDRHAAVLDRHILAPRERMDLAIALGNAYMSAGRHHVAERWLNERLALRQHLNQQHHPYAVGDHMAMALNLGMQGRHREALAGLDGAPRFGAARGEGGGSPERWGRELVWTRANLLVDAGDAAAALELLDRAAPAADDLPRDRTRHRLLRGAALCAAGRQAEGLPLLLSTEAAVNPAREHPHSPWRAAERARLGLCALAAGDRALAQRSALQARRAIDAQAEVAPYYQERLIELEAALAGRRPARVKASV